MTARRYNDTESDNSGVRRKEVDAQTLLESIRHEEHVTVDGLAKRAGTTRDELRPLLDDLRDRGLITIDQRMHAVHVRPTDVEDSVATDGGLIGTLLSALTADQTAVDIAEQDLYECLADERRRKVIRFLAGLYDGDELVFVEVSTLAEALAKNENGGDLATDDVHRHYVSLVQVHLPLLDSLGLIEYYDRPKKLRSTEDAVAVADLMAAVTEICHGKRWYEATSQTDEDEG